MTWDRDDFVAVAQEQNAASDAAARDGSPVLFCDTVAGTPGDRLRAAVAATDALLAEGWSFAPPLSPAPAKPCVG